MMLARQDLLAAWRRKRIRFEPDISPEQINLSSIDLRLGYIFTRQKAQPSVAIRPAQDFDPSGLVLTETLNGDQDILRLAPKEFVLAQTLEKITLPATLAAHVHGRSSLARSGLAIHATAPHIHPGFVGQITLELFNHGEWELQFFPGRDAICHVIFWEVKTPPLKKAIEILSTYSGQRTPYPPRRNR